MEVKGITANGEEFLLNALSITLDREYGVPADSAEIILPYSSDTPEFAELRITDGDEPVFRGTVDVNERQLSSGGGYIRLEARNQAGILLDNESRPCVYNGVSASVIFENHIKPYGVSGFYGRDLMLEGKFIITKGMNEWQAVREFCRRCYGTFPYFSPDGKVYFEPEANRETVFSNSGGGVVYTSATEKRNRCSLISGVYIKTSDMQNYSLCIRGKTAEQKGVTAVRYLDAAQTKLTPMSCADEMISLGEENYYMLELSCPLRALPVPGDNAVVKDSCLDLPDNLFVARVKYSHTQSGETTKILLKRRGQ